MVQSRFPTNPPCQPERHRRRQGSRCGTRVFATPVTGIPGGDPLGRMFQFGGYAFSSSCAKSHVHPHIHPREWGVAASGRHAGVGMPHRNPFALTLHREPEVFGPPGFPNWGESPVTVPTLTPANTTRAKKWPQGHCPSRHATCCREGGEGGPQPRPPRAPCTAIRVSRGAAHGRPLARGTGGRASPTRGLGGHGVPGKLAEPNHSSTG